MTDANANAIETVTASCACGALSIDLTGISEERHLCCCSDCQKRTGTAFGTSWYYDIEELIAVRGDYGTFPRTGPRGTEFDFHYCPSCGSTVFWHADGDAAIGVAGGCVPVAQQVSPQDVVWTCEKPAWFEPPRDIPWFERGTSSPVVWQPTQ